MAQRKDGLLIADQHGLYRLYEADTAGCWHYETPCDRTCATAGREIRCGYVPTNAYGPATVRAAQAGYHILNDR